MGVFGSDTYHFKCLTSDRTGQIGEQTIGHGSICLGCFVLRWSPWTLPRDSKGPGVRGHMKEQV